MKALALVLVMSFSLPLIAGAAADPLPRAKAEEVGLSSEKLDRIGRILRADVERGRIPGAVVIVARRAASRTSTRWASATRPPAPP